MTLTAHKLANLLLQQPDVPCLINGWDSDEGDQKEVSHILSKNGFILLLHEGCILDWKDIEEIYDLTGVVDALKVLYYALDDTD